MEVIMMTIIVIQVIIEIKITTIVMMMRIKMIEENGMGRRGVYFKWRSSQKFCKVDGFKRQIKVTPKNEGSSNEASRNVCRAHNNGREIKERCRTLL